MPSPSGPVLAQHHRVPPVLIAQTSPPAATIFQSVAVPTWTGVAEVFIVPSPSHRPQHHSVPFCLIAHVTAPDSCTLLAVAAMLSEAHVLSVPICVGTSRWVDSGGESFPQHHSV